MHLLHVVAIAIRLLSNAKQEICACVNDLNSNGAHGHDGVAAIGREKRGEEHHNRESSEPGKAGQSV